MLNKRIIYIFVARPHCFYKQHFIYDTPQRTGATQSFGSNVGRHLYCWGICF